MQFSEFMRRLGAHLGLPDLAPDAQGACAIDRHGVQVRFYAEHDDCITSIAPLGQVDLNDERQLQALVRPDVFAGAANGGTVGIDGQGCVYLAQPVRLGNQCVVEFMGALESFLAAARHLSDALASGQQIQAS